MENDNYYSELVHMLFVDCQVKAKNVQREFDHTRDMSPHLRDMVRECMVAIDEARIAMYQEGQKKRMNPNLLEQLGYYQ